MPGKIDFRRFSAYRRLDDLSFYSFTLDDLVKNSEKINWFRVVKDIPIMSIEDLDKIIDYINISQFLLLSRYFFKIEKDELSNYLDRIKISKPEIFRKYNGGSVSIFTKRLTTKADPRFYPKFLEHFGDTHMCNWTLISSKQDLSFEDIERYKKKLNWSFIRAFNSLNADFIFENRNIIHGSSGSSDFLRIVSKFEFTDNQLEIMANEGIITWQFIFSKYEKSKEFFIQYFTKLVEEKNVKSPMTVLRYVNPQTLSKFIDKDILLLLKLY
jgi:hypothetical protein